MEQHEILNWLLEGDVAIQYQVYRDLLSIERKDLQDSIAQEGWGARFLAKRNTDGHWGKAFYQPKWISTHYTLLDLRNLCIVPTNPLIRESIQLILKNEKAGDGGLLPIGKTQLTDLCINGMFLNYASYFKTNESDLKSVVDCILAQIMPDGGFNCRSNRFRTVHSSLHTTISVLEGITEYELNTYNYRIGELIRAKQKAIEFVLKHQLFLSDRTGVIINKDFLKLTYPGRWRYDILRALDYFQHASVKWDDRMMPAMRIVLKKRNRDSTWNVQAKHPGQVHFEMEKAGKPSRWNTLRVLRVLKHFKFEVEPKIIIVFGLPGSGKSYFAERLAKRLDAEYLNSDRLRRELFPKRTYSKTEKSKVYAVMSQKMQEAYDGRKNLVLDATFHKKQFRDLISKHFNGKIHFIRIWADEHLIKERLKKNRPYSEADFTVHRLLLQEWEPMKETHLSLESTNENIDYMLQSALEYLKNDARLYT